MVNNTYARIEVSRDYFNGGYKVRVWSRAQYSAVWYTEHRDNGIRSLQQATEIARTYRKSYRAQGYAIVSSVD